MNSSTQLFGQVHLRLKKSLGYYFILFYLSIKFLFIYLFIFYKNLVLNENSVDSHQTPRSVAYALYYGLMVLFEMTCLHFCAAWLHSSLFSNTVCLHLQRFMKNKTNNEMNRNVRKRTFIDVRPEKIQISLRIRAVWSESSLGAFWIAKDAKPFFMRRTKSDQTSRMRRLIWVLVGRSCQKVRFLTLHFKCNHVEPVTVRIRGTFPSSVLNFFLYRIIPSFF